MPTPVTSEKSQDVFGNSNSLVSVLKGRAPKTALTLAAAQFVYPHLKGLVDKFGEKTRFVISIDSTDELYDDLHEWILSLLSSDDQHALRAYSGRRNDDGSSPVSDSSSKYSWENRPAPKVRFRYDGKAKRTIMVDGNKVSVEIDSGERYHDSGRTFYSDPPKIIFTTQSKQGRDALQRQMDFLLKKRHETKRIPVLYMAKSWGSWDRLDSIAPRSLESVVLPEGQIEGIVDDLQSFLDNEKTYMRRCVSWHRGYLFHGPPGTGKTSAALALANHFDLDVWYLPLADATKDSNLIELVGRVTARSLLLLEDVDVFHATTERTENGTTTLSGVLNALDGVATPHGLITIMTTNDRSALDSALIRPGRIDREELFGLAGYDQAARLFEWFFETPWPLDPLGYFLGPDAWTDVAPSDIVGVMHQHKDDPRRAYEEIVSLGKKTVDGEKKKKGKYSEDAFLSA